MTHALATALTLALLPACVGDVTAVCVPHVGAVCLKPCEGPYPVGPRGYCTEDCEGSTPCPQHHTCAHVYDGTGSWHACLRRCPCSPSLGECNPETGLCGI